MKGKTETIIIQRQLDCGCKQPGKKCQGIHTVAIKCKKIYPAINMCQIIWHSYISIDQQQMTGKYLILNAIYNKITDRNWQNKRSIY